MNKIVTENAPKAIGPYSQGMVFENLVFSSGQIPVNPATGEIEGTSIETQAAQSCKNVAAVLEDFPVFNQVYESYFVSSPARSCVAVKTLPKNVLCEIEAIAYKE